MGCEASSQQIQQASNYKNGIDNRKKKKNNKINGRISIKNQIFQNVIQIKKGIACSQLALIDKALCSHFLFYKLSKVDRLELIQCMKKYYVEENQYIFKQGDPASLFFIISKGKVGIQINGAQVKTVNEGQYFGQLALLYTAPRSASVIAIQNCQFWCLSQGSFKKTIQNLLKKNYILASSYVNKLNTFKFLTQQQKDAISYNMHNLKYQKNQIIFKQGDDANSFYIIISGEVQLQIPGKNQLIFKSGDCFGQNSFKEGQIRTGTAKGRGQVQCLSIGRQAVKQCLGGQFQQLRYANICKWSLKRSKLFKQAPAQLHQKLSQLITYKKYEKLSSIIRQGDQVRFLAINLDSKVNGLQTGNILFQQYLNNPTKKCDKDYIMQSKGAIALLQISKIRELFGNNLASAIQKNDFSKFEEKDHLKLALNQNQQKKNNLNLKDFNVVKKLGQGQFGKVVLVSNKLDPKQKYALKCIEKNMILKNQMQIFIKQQRQILQQINFPLIVQLENTYKDEHYLYLLMQFIDGGDFFDIIREIGLLNSKTARFYLACLLLCIEYLHSKNIIYRDLKPENAVVDQQGYLYMIDLGTAKILKKQQGFRTFTIIGTPHYMAPQIIQGKGYGFPTDIWSLGVIFFQMVCGGLPYGQDADDPYQIYKEVTRDQLQFPQGYKDIKAKQLILRLMQKNPSRRSVQNFRTIKKMAFFETFNWQGLLQKKLSVPYKPKKKNQNEKKDAYSLTNYLERQKNFLQKPTKPSQPNWDNYF